MLANLKTNKAKSGKKNCAFLLPLQVISGVEKFGSATNCWDGQVLAGGGERTTFGCHHLLFPPALQGMGSVAGLSPAGIPWPAHIGIPFKSFLFLLF